LMQSSHTCTHPAKCRHPSRNVLMGTVVLLEESSGSGGDSPPSVTYILYKGTQLMPLSFTPPGCCTSTGT
jgi:hypothetical protein